MGTQPSVLTKVIIWAIDPFEGETQPGRLLVDKLKHWAQSAQLQVQPVYVLSLPRDESEEFLNGSGLAHYISTIEKVSERHLQDIGMEGALPVKVVFSSSSSHKEQVDALLRFAESKNSACIIVSSHGKSGVPRLLFGSFAENLLLTSKWPIFFLTHLPQNLKSETSDKGIKRILYATDFSDSSLEAFIQFLPQAKRFQFELILFHSVTLPATALASGYECPLPVSTDYFPDQMKWANEKGAKWVELAESNGIPARFIVKDEGFGSQVGDKILGNAYEEGAGMIVMASTSGTFTSFVMGSVARAVIRSNCYPVWIYGPKALEKEQRPCAETSFLHEPLL